MRTLNSPFMPPPWTRTSMSSHQQPYHPRLTALGV